MTPPVFLTLKEYRFTLVAREPVALPEYCGSTLRGAFGNAFRASACVFPGKACSACLLRETCAYSWVFETPMPAGVDLPGVGGSNLPHPFILCPPWDGPAEIGPGKPFSFQVVLVGKGIGYLPYFILAVEKMGSRGLGVGRGRFQLRAVWDVLPEGSRIVWRRGALARDATDAPLMWNPDEGRHRAPDELVAQFVTPVRLTAQGGLDTDLDFQAFLRSLLRRIKLLAAFHCANGARWDYRPVLEEAADVRTVERDCRPRGWLRWSQRQGRKLLLDGVTGYLRLSGVPDTLLPFLEIGQVIHVGKATAFGFGRYQLNPDFTR